MFFLQKKFHQAEHLASVHHYAHLLSDLNLLCLTFGPFPSNNCGMVGYDWS